MQIAASLINILLVGGSLGPKASFFAYGGTLWILMRFILLASAELMVNFKFL